MFVCESVRGEVCVQYARAREANGAWDGGRLLRALVRVRVVGRERRREDWYTSVREETSSMSECNISFKTYATLRDSTMLRTANGRAEGRRVRGGGRARLERLQIALCHVRGTLFRRENGTLLFRLLQAA